MDVYDVTNLIKKMIWKIQWKEALIDYKEQKCQTEPRNSFGSCNFHHFDAIHWHFGSSTRNIEWYKMPDDLLIWAVSICWITIDSWIQVMIYAFIRCFSRHLKKPLFEIQSHMMNKWKNIAGSHRACVSVLFRTHIPKCVVCGLAWEIISSEMFAFHSAFNKQSTAKSLLTSYSVGTSTYELLPSIQQIL